MHTLPLMGPILTGYDDPKNDQNDQSMMDYHLVMVDYWGIMTSLGSFQEILTGPDDPKNDQNDYS